MKSCEDCGDECKRRITCCHCKLLVCPWCWNHVHCCGPSHTPAECRDRPAKKAVPAPEVTKP
jgi:hypothetical protein